MKLWIDDVRSAPEGYVLCKSVNEAKYYIQSCESWRRNSFNLHGYYTEFSNRWIIELIDIDHDAGDCANDDGDYIKLLDWLEETGRNYPIRIHSMNPVGRENMRVIIRRNGWTEVT